MEGRWAKLAVRAQRDGILDYRTYTPGDANWLLRERILMSSIEDQILVEHSKLIFPGLSGEAQETIFNSILSYEMPWVAKELSKSNQIKKLIQQYDEEIGID